MGTDRVCRGVTDSGHDGDEDMFFDGERARVDGNTQDLDVGQEASPEATEGVRQQLGDK